MFPIEVKQVCVPANCRLSQFQPQPPEGLQLAALESE
jgi:hypothetical protein